MMIFLVVLIALVIERFFDWSHLRQWGWYGKCERFAMQKIPGASPYLVLAGAIIPLMAVLAIGQYLFGNVVYGFPWLIFQLVVLLYCFGPKNLWADAFASANALKKGDAQAAADTLQSTFQISAVHHADSLQRELLSQIYVSANQRIFAVIFWYMVLGLPGAVMYRLINLSMVMPSTPEINAAARLVAQVLDWVPARILSFLFALGGNFTRVVNCWRKRVLHGLDGSDALLADCGVAAVTDDTERLPEDGSAEKNALSLLDRSFIIVLVIILIVDFII